MDLGLCKMSQKVNFATIAFTQLVDATKINSVIGYVILEARNHHATNQIENIDSIVENLLSKFQDIFDVGVIQDKSKELLAVESLAIETDALSIIKFCEEFLNITRGLKESWCLDSIKVNAVENKTLQQEEINYIFGKFNQLTDRIVNDDIADHH